MENRIELNKIIETYLRFCYLVPDYVDMHKANEKKAYTSYFNSLTTLSEAATENYLDDFFINDIRNDFFTHQIYVSNCGSIGVSLLKESHKIIQDLISILVDNEWYEAAINIKKILNQ